MVGIRRHHITSTAYWSTPGLGERESWWLCGRPSAGMPYPILSNEFKGPRVCMGLSMRQPSEATSLARSPGWETCSLTWDARVMFKRQFCLSPSSSLPFYHCLSSRLGPALLLPLAPPFRILMSSGLASPATDR